MKKGYKLSPKRKAEVVKNLTNRFKKGHEMPDDIKRKISRKMSGENHYNWKGGLTKIVFRIRHSFEYRQWRSDVFTRDDFTCVLCGKRGVYLEADHFPKPFYQVIKENLITSFE